MKAMKLILILSLFSTHLAFGKTKKKANFQLSIDTKKIEFIQSKVKEKEIVVAKKTFHGKPIQEVKKIAINKDLNVKGNKDLNKYYELIKTTLMDQFNKDKATYKKPLKGSVSAKIQIQYNGDYDLLFVEGKNPQLVERVNQLFSNITNFPPIPMELGQDEFQIKIPLSYSYN